MNTINEYKKFLFKNQIVQLVTVPREDKFVHYIGKIVFVGTDIIVIDPLTPDEKDFLFKNFSIDNAHATYRIITKIEIINEIIIISGNDKTNT